MAAFENNTGWMEFTDGGAYDFIKSLGWEVGIEFNNPDSKDEWDYERLVLRTAEKSKELNLDWDFVVIQGYPDDVFPEERGPNDPPTFSSVLNKVFDFYNASDSS